MGVMRDASKSQKGVQQQPLASVKATHYTLTRSTLQTPQHVAAEGDQSLGLLEDLRKF
jgi:hypothetical protein